MNLVEARTCSGTELLTYLPSDNLGGIAIHRNHTKIALVGLLIISLFAGGSVIAESDGISGMSVDSGCACHGGGSEDASVSAELTGLPEGEYTPGETYHLTLTINGGPDASGTNSGGFNLRATGGTLTSTDDTTQIENGELTHSTSGNDVRTWSFDWTAPTVGTITLSGHVNAVDGDGAASADDAWNSFSVEAQGPPVKGDPVGFQSHTAEPLDMTGYFALGGFVAMLVIVGLQRKSDF